MACIHHPDSRPGQKPRRWLTQISSHRLIFILAFVVILMTVPTKALHSYRDMSAFSVGSRLDLSGSHYSNGNGNGRIPPGLKVVKESDVVFGGLFPMHERGVQGDATCGRIKREKGIQRLEAMLYAVDLLNSNEDILPGLNIGLNVLDTCSDDTFALEQCMDFIKAQLQLSSFDVEDYSCLDGSTPRYHRLRPVAGVIGAASSPVSIMVANILRLFKVRMHVFHICDVMT